MSRLNIIGIIKGIKSKTNVYTPIIEAVVNSIDAIYESGRKDGEIKVVIKRESTLDFKDGNLPAVQSVEIIDNGVGFTQKNRDSFDTYYSDQKIAKGGKGFGRFMFLKYFGDTTISSVYKTDSGEYRLRQFQFGKQFDIIVNETDVCSDNLDTETHVYLNNIIDKKYLDKGLDTIARKLLERLLIFFVDDSYPCPIIKVMDISDPSSTIILNNYIGNLYSFNILICSQFNQSSIAGTESENLAKKYLFADFCILERNVSLLKIAVRLDVIMILDLFSNNSTRVDNMLVASLY